MPEQKAWLVSLQIAQVLLSHGMPSRQALPPRG